MNTPLTIVWGCKAYPTKWLRVLHILLILLKLRKRSKKQENGKIVHFGEIIICTTLGGLFFFFFPPPQFCQVRGLAINHKRNEPNVENSSGQC